MITEREAKQLDEDGERLLGIYQKGLHASLLQEVDELSKTKPLSASALGIASLSCCALGRYDDALSSAHQALQQPPAGAWLHAAAAAAKAGLGQLDGAIAAQRQAVLLMPGEAGYRATLARYLREQGNLTLSARTAQEALLTAPEHAGALNELGLTLMAMKAPVEAQAQFRLAQQCAPSDPSAYLHEGLLHLREGTRNEACRCFRAALKRRPGFHEAEDRLLDTFVGENGALRALSGHVATLGRVTLVGWLMIAFLYYLTFRMLEFIWNLFPGFHLIGQSVLMALLLYLACGFLLGRFLRFTLGVWKA